MIRDPKSFCFNFDFHKDTNENLKPAIEFIIKSNEYLKQLLSKYKNENNFNEHIKQQGE